jgi:acetyltransferase
LLQSGGQLAPLSAAMTEALSQVLPPQWSHGNPIDVLGDADPQRYKAVLNVVTATRESDGLLVILTPQAMTQPEATAEVVASYAKRFGKPILASWMGGAATSSGEAVLNHAGIPTFPYPDTAARVFTSMWRYSDNLRSLYETPMLTAGGEQPGQERVAETIARARQKGQMLLDEVASKDVLAAYGIPTVETHRVENEDAAVAIADALGYPVVLKVRSPTITHKSDLGGVQINLLDAEAVRCAFRQIKAALDDTIGAEQFMGVTVQPMVRDTGYELILGSSIDPQFGPVLLFGAGNSWRCLRIARWGCHRSQPR